MAVSVKNTDTKVKRLATSPEDCDHVEWLALFSFDQKIIDYLLNMDEQVKLKSITT